MRIDCKYCQCFYHIKFITLSIDFLEEISADVQHWLRHFCLTTTFSFNNTEEDLEFIGTIDDLSPRDTLKYISDKLFIPFELNDQDHSSNLCDIDPDLNFYNALNQLTSKCNYYLESSFNSVINKASGTKDLFYLCHLNIRSLKKNYASLDAYLSLLDIKFTAIGITET